MSERRLVFAVLQKAYEDATGFSKYKPDPDKALKWFFSDMDGMGSYLWYCDLVNLNSLLMRNKIIERNEEKRTLGRRDGKRKRENLS